MKITTQKLREMMTEWLSNPEMRTIPSIRVEEALHDDEDVTQEHIDSAAEDFGLAKGLTRQFVEEHIWKMWSRSENWVRAEKHILKENAPDYFYNSSGATEFIRDLYGASNKELVAKFSKNMKAAEKCVCRVFFPKSECLADKYRLEVVTTPEDDAVVGWCMFSDYPHWVNSSTDARTHAAMRSRCYEGFCQAICMRGHYSVFPDNRMLEEQTHCDCGVPYAWWNFVDDTNCDQYGVIPNFVMDKFIIKPQVVEKCNLGHEHVTSRAVYRFPTEVETLQSRHWCEHVGGSVIYRPFGRHVKSAKQKS